MISRLNRFLDHLEEWLIAGLMAAATLVIFASILHREALRVEALWAYARQIHFSWAQELCIYLFIWMAKFGAAYGVRTGIHIGVDVLVENVGPSARRALVTVALGLGAFFTAVIAVVGVRWVLFIRDTGQVSPDLEWPMWIVYLCIPLGSALMCYRFVQVMTRYLRTGELPRHAPEAVGESRA
ncbi:MAG TPA: TRAP transporter small permease [Burkholderiales bacterium]|nr:TRAP transporter small permease [Burkholderiales bacterium]